VAVKRVKAKAKVSTRANDPTPGSLKESVRDKPGRAKKGSIPALVVVEDVAAVPKEFGLTRRNYPPEPFFREAGCRRCTRGDRPGDRRVGEERRRTRAVALSGGT
jgi:hypothetical protein